MPAPSPRRRNGTAIIALALTQLAKEGIKVDSVVFLGSSIPRDYDMTSAARGATAIYNLHSTIDIIAGAGQHGFDRRAGNVHNVDVSDPVVHTNDNDAQAKQKDKPGPGMQVGWISNYVGRTFMSRYTALAKGFKPCLKGGTKLIK
jgi:hypothetical protein